MWRSRISACRTGTRRVRREERVGVVYPKPAIQLLDRVVAARALAVQVAAHKADPSTLASARGKVTWIAQVDAVHALA